MGRWAWEPVAPIAGALLGAAMLWPAADDATQESLADAA